MTNIDKIIQEIQYRFFNLGADISKIDYDFIHQKLQEVRLHTIEECINDFWNNEELQNAITEYGEWNGEELNKVKEKILNKLKDEN